MGFRANMSSAQGTPVRLNFWGVPLATALVGSLSWIAISWGYGAVTGWGYPALQSGPYTGTDVSFVAFLLFPPICMAITSMVAFLATLSLGRVWGSFSGFAVGLVAALILGTQTPALENWWLSGVPTDTNVAAGQVAVTVSVFVAITIAFCLKSVGSYLPFRLARNRILGVGIFASLVSGSIGGPVGGVVGAMDAFKCTCSSDVANVVGPAQTGLIVGAVLGFLMGLVTGLIVGYLLERLMPPTDFTPTVLPPYRPDHRWPSGANRGRKPPQGEVR